jgi:hypothetical protein
MIINQNGILVRQNDDLKFVTNTFEYGDDARELAIVKNLDSKKFYFKNN